MLTLINNNDGEGLFFKTIRILLTRLVKLDKENRNDPRKNPRYHMPKFTKMKFERRTNNALFFDFTLNKYGKKLSFNLAIPIFTSLENRTIHKSKIHYYEHIMEEHSKLWPKDNNTDERIEDAIVKLFYNPVSILSGTIFSLANIIGLALPNIANQILPQMLQASSLSLQLGIIVGGIVYLLPVVGYIYVTKFSIPNFESSLDDITKHINCNQKNIAREKLKSIPNDNVSWYFLFYRFPRHRQIIRRFYTLSGTLSNTTDELRKALKFVDTEQEKLEILIKIINIHAESFKNTLRKINRYEIDNEEDLCQKAKINCLENHVPYLAQIPTNIPLFLELGSKVRNQLHNCIDSLKQRQFDKAKEQFYAIKWDEYSKHAYPDAAIMYYQLDSIMVIVEKEGMRLTHLGQKFSAYNRLLVVMENAEEIIDIIRRYYPELSAEYEQLINAYIDTIKSMDEAKEPELEVEVLPDLYTPLAWAAKLKTAMQQQSDEDNDNDTGARNRSSSSPIYNGNNISARRRSSSSPI